MFRLLGRGSRRLIAIIAVIVGVVLTTLIAFGNHVYRNKIVYSSATVSGRVCVAGGVIGGLTGDETGRPIATQRLSIKNHGIRSLDNVELHWPVSNKPVFWEVSKTTELSAASVLLDHERDFVKISISSFPSGEDLSIDLIFSGYEWQGKDLKGTGGRYKIVRKAAFDLARSTFLLGVTVLWVTLWLLFNVVSPMITYLSAPKPSVSAVPAVQPKP